MSSLPVALVTGASKGLGLEIALHLVNQGYLVLGCSRSEVDVPADGIVHIVADVADEKSVTKMFKQVRERYGRLDAVICNAGIASMNPLLLSPKSSASQMLETNVIGTMLVAREAARLLRKSDHGRIVTMSSVAVPLTLEGESVYSASKAAIEQFTKVIARELAPFGITSNCIGPGPIDTDLIAGVPDEKIDELAARLVGGQKTTFDDVLNVVDFFLAKSSQAVTGQVVYLGGV